ncbi:hypothetical protein [Noviherbaspirillum sedimenti]|nr:hypothetical protein [Noviherbaspirillum sedimenti]
MITGQPNDAAWRDEWRNPFESPLSLLWKFAWANCLTAGEICKALFGRNLTSSLGMAVHGRTLLTPTWIRHEYPYSGPVATAVANGGLEEYTRYWATALASDAAIRYCPKCMQRGYQTIFAQLDGLQQCLIHAEPLLAHCTNCTAATPRFALVPETMDAPWRCPSCLHPFGGVFQPSEWVTTPSEKACIYDAFEPIDHWLRNLEHASLEWSGQREWHGRWLAEPLGHMKRIMTFSVLRTLEPIDLPDSFLAKPDRSMAITVGSSVPDILLESRLIETPPDNRGLISIYKSIRRYLRRRLGPCARIDDGMTNEDIFWKDQILNLSRKLCPRKQAMLLWRLRFEDIDQFQQSPRRQAPRLHLRESALNWPWQATANQTAWAGFALTSAHASFEVVANWWERAKQLQDEDIYGRDRAHALTLYLEFAPFLSPIKTPVLPQITMLLNVGVHQKGEAMVVVGPGPRFDDLEPCPHCELHVNHHCRTAVYS